MRIGYVLKRYPRLSETFIVNELLAHEAAGADLEIFALGASFESRIQANVARVRAPVTYLHQEGLKAEALWRQLQAAADLSSPQEIASWLEAARRASANEAAHAIELAHTVRHRKIGHLHAHFGTSAATVARLAARLAGIPYSFTAHAKDIYHESVDHDHLALKFADASAVVTVSDFNLQHLTRHYPQPLGGIRRIYNGLARENYPYEDPEHREPRIAAVGRLVEKKGFDVLIQACQLLHQRGIHFQCDIIGGGEQGPILHRLIEQANLQQRITMHGPLPQAEALQIMRQAAVLAAPCVTAASGDQDGLPTVLLEAMAIGTPAVATPVTGIPEAILHDVTGWIVPERSPVLLAAAIERLLGDSLLRVRLARAARRHVEERFDISRNAAELRTLFATARATAKLKETQSIEIMAEAI